MSDWPTTERLNDPSRLRLTVEEELPTDDTIDDSDDPADEAVVGREQEEGEGNGPAQLPSEKLMD
jgi:hypothetical protein